MFQAQNRETTNNLKSCCVLQDHYDDERDKTVFHNTKPDLQDQDHRVQDQDQDQLKPIFWSETGLVLRSTVSDHITGFGRHSTLIRSKLDRATTIRRPK